MDLLLKGKRAIVTGGSSGLGKAIARALAEEGVDVVIAARTRDKLEAAATELSAATGGKVIGLVADTKDDASVKAMVDRAVATLGGVDILVNSAAQPGGAGHAASINEVNFAKVIYDLDVKVAGYLRTAQAVAPHMVKNGWGRIFNLGGLAAHITGNYAAGVRCVAVTALTKNLADELGPKGVTANTIHPGIMRTEKTTPEHEAMALRTSSVGKMIDASELAWLVTVLASPKSIAVNGETIAAGGGMPHSIYY